MWRRSICLEIVVEGTKATFYVDDMGVPALVMPEAFRGDYRDVVVLHAERNRGQLSVRTKW